MAWWLKSRSKYDFGAVGIAQAVSGGNILHFCTVYHPSREYLPPSQGFGKVSGKSSPLQWCYYVCGVTGNAAICSNIISASLNVLIFHTYPHPRSSDPDNLSSASCIQCPRCCQMGPTIADTKWAFGGPWLHLPMHVKRPIRLKSLFIISWRHLNLQPPCAWHQIWSVLLLILMDLREQNIEDCFLVFDAHQHSWLVRDRKFIWGLEQGCFSWEYFFFFWQPKRLSIQPTRSPLRAAWWADIFGLMDKVWQCIPKCLPLVKRKKKITMQYLLWRCLIKAVVSSETRCFSTKQ